MPFPKQVKPNINLVPPKTLSARREELLEYINKDGTYLPKSVLHADLDLGMLEFVKNELKTTVSGKDISVVNKIITNQRWSQFTETWDFVDPDFNVQLPFITVVRKPEVKYGTNPSLQYTIPVRKQFYYATVPTWNGNQKGYDIYTIPQPVPVDIDYSVKIMCNRMRELNEFNKNVIQTFASRQAYRQIEGHYIPIILTNISDESQMDIGKRKFYIQSYEFTMMGFLLDEEEFEVAPAVSRVFNSFEVNISSKPPRRKRFPENKDTFEKTLVFSPSATTKTLVADYTGDFTLLGSVNVSSYDVFINGNFYGTDIEVIQVNTNDILLFEITQDNPSLESSLLYGIKLLI